MKKQILFGVYILVLISLISLVSAREYNLDNGDSVVVDGKTVQLAQVSSSGSAVIYVNGDAVTIPKNTAKTINGLEIHVVSSYWVDNQAARSAVIDVHISGQICQIDNFCDYRQIEPWGDSILYYRGKTIEILDRNSAFITLRVDGQEVTLSAPSFSNNDPFSTVDIINDIGLRYNLIFDTELLYLGENFDNCSSDCKLDENKDIRLIKDFCQDGEQNEISGEEGIDCGGICERDCNWECVENEECIDKCDIIENSKLITCLCENNECIDRTYCKFDNDCVQVQNDLCGCDFISINREYKSIWDNGINQIFSSKSCLDQCSYVDKNPVCENNKCVLSNQILLGDNLYKFIDKIVKNGGYTIVLGDDAPSLDTLAASEINLKFQQYSNLDTNLPVELASLTKRKDKLILIGHPCDNPLISQPSCDGWPYEKDKALIKISGDNLIISGTTPLGTSEAARMVSKYGNYNDFRNTDEFIVQLVDRPGGTVIIDEEGNEIPLINSICGDGICDINETCKEDCKLENQTEEIQEKTNKEYKGILHRFFSWLVALFK